MSRTQFLRIQICLAVLLFAVTSAQAVPVVVNSSFELPDISPSTNSTTVPTGWTKTGSAFIFDNSFVGLPNYESNSGDQFVQLGNSNNNFGSLSQAIAGTIAGQFYDISVHVNTITSNGQPTPAAPPTITFGGLTLVAPTITASATNPALYNLYTFTNILATSNDSILEFSTVNPVAYIDDVAVVDSAVSAVPEIDVANGVIPLAAAIFGLLLLSDRRRSTPSVSLS